MMKAVVLLIAAQSFPHAHQHFFVPSSDRYQPRNQFLEVFLSRDCLFAPWPSSGGCHCYSARGQNSYDVRQSQAAPGSKEPADATVRDVRERNHLQVEGSLECRVMLRPVR